MSIRVTNLIKSEGGLRFKTTPFSFVTSDTIRYWDANSYTGTGTWNDDVVAEPFNLGNGVNFITPINDRNFFTVNDLGATDNFVINSNPSFVDAWHQSTADFTLLMWMRAGNPPGTNQRMEHFSTHQPTVVAGINTNIRGAVSTTRYSASVNTQFNQYTSLTPLYNQNILFAFSGDSNGYAIQQNTTRQTTSFSANVNTAQLPLAIFSTREAGAPSWIDTSWRLYNFRILNRALNQTELTNLFNREKSQFGL